MSTPPSLAHDALRKVGRWCREVRLSVNPENPEDGSKMEEGIAAGLCLSNSKRSVYHYITRQVLHDVPGRSHSHNGMCNGGLTAGL